MAPGPLRIEAGETAEQDPSDVRVYDFEWDTKNLAVGVQIAGAATWTITPLTPGAPALTKDQESILAGNRIARVRLQGGAHLADYNIACKITTNETPTQTKEQSFTVSVRNR